MHAWWHYRGRSRNSSSSRGRVAGAARPNFFLRSSRNRVDLLSYKSKPTDKREHFDCRAKKNLDGWSMQVHKNFHCMLPIEEEQRWTTAYVPVQKNFSPAVVLLSFIIRFVLVREQIDSNTTGWPRKNWTGTQIYWGSCNSHVELNRRRDVKYSQQLLRQKRTSGRLCWIKKDFFKNLSSLTSSHPTFILSPSLPARLSWVSY